jgi:hypothetical protein
MLTVYEWFGLNTTRTVFTGLASKPVATVSSGLASKPTATVFASLASKLVATVFPGLTLKLVVSFLVEPQNQGGGGFSVLCLKTDSSDLVIWASKLPRRFLSLDLKIKWGSVCRLRHKTDGGRSVRDMCQDLAACLSWKQVWLGFLSLVRRLMEARRRVVHVAPSQRLRRRQAEDGRVDATGSVGPCYPCFTVFFLLAARGVVVI